MTRGMDQGQPPPALGLLSALPCWQLTLLNALLRSRGSPFFRTISAAHFRHSADGYPANLSTGLSSQSAPASPLRASHAPDAYACMHVHAFRLFDQLSSALCLSVDYSSPRCLAVLGNQRRISPSPLNCRSATVATQDTSALSKLTRVLFLEFRSDCRLRVSIVRSRWKIGGQ